MNLNNDRSKYLFVIKLGIDGRTSSRIETELILEAKLMKDYQTHQKDDPLDVDVSEIDKTNHYVSVEDHGHLVKGYFALEGKLFKAVDDDFRINRAQENARRVIRPIKNNAYRVSGSSEGTNRLWFTANANYEKRQTTTSKGFNEINSSSPKRETGFKSQESKNPVTYKAIYTKKKDIKSKEGSKLYNEEEFSHLQMDGTFYSKSNGMQDIDTFLKEAQNKGVPLDTKYQPMSISQLNIGSAIDKRLIMPLEFQLSFGDHNLLNIEDQATKGFGDQRRDTMNTVYPNNIAEIVSQKKIKGITQTQLISQILPKNMMNTVTTSSNEFIAEHMYGKNILADSKDSTIEAIISESSAQIKRLKGTLYILIL